MPSVAKHWLLTSPTCRDTAGRPRLVPDKYQKLTQSYWTGNHRRANDPPTEDEIEMGPLIHFARVTLTDPTDCDAVMQMAVTATYSSPTPNEC
jgi:hypothetical protein